MHINQAQIIFKSLIFCGEFLKVRLLIISYITILKGTLSNHIHTLENGAPFSNVNIDISKRRSLFWCAKRCAGSPFGVTDFFSSSGDYTGLLLKKYKAKNEK